MSMRGPSIITITLIVLSMLLPERAAARQTELSALDVSALVRSTVSIFATRNCEFTGDSAQAPEGVPSFDVLLDSCPEGLRGSGTILDADGTILTNAHVALTSLENDAKPVWLLVSVTTDAREAPEPRFFARAETFDVLLDLAIIRPAFDLDGYPLGDRDIATLALQPLPIAKDPVSIGDEILNIGYPGIGGDLVTVTSGRISGFQSDLNNPTLENEGWFKTDATLAGGLSGGATVNAVGELVGIPTRVGAIDVRRLDDTTPVSIGQINYIRPIHVGIPELSRRTAEAGQPEVPVLEEYLLATEAPAPNTGDALPSRPNANEGTILGPGNDDVDADATEAEPTVETPSAPAMVTVSGSIIEVSSGEPIAGAYFVVLQPGHTFQEWYNAGLPTSTVYTGAIAAPDGTFTLFDPLEPGQEYTYIVAADGYDFVWGNNFEIVPAGTEGDLELAPIQLWPSPLFDTGEEG